MSIDIDAMMQARAAEGWGSGATDAQWFQPDAMMAKLKALDGRVQEDRETLKRMWRAVAATPAGRHVLENLMHEYVLKQSFDVTVAGHSLEQLAMYGIWRDAQRHLVNTILGLAGSGQPPTPATEQTHGGSGGGGRNSADGTGGGDGGSGLRFGFVGEPGPERGEGSDGG